MLALACASVAELAQNGHEAAAWLSASERQRCDRLGVHRVQEFLAGRRLLRQLLVRQGLIDAEERVAISVGGAPALAGFPQIHLSISHRAGWVVAAISDGPVGMDVEVVKPRDIAAMADQVCTALEKEHLESLSPANALLEFHQVWALKEAAFKSGLSRHDSMAFHRFGLVRDETDQCYARSWAWPDGRIMACVAADFRDCQFQSMWPGASPAQRWAAYCV